MSYGKAVEEVWEWRAALEKELEGKSPEEQRNYINDKADKICKEYGIRARKPHEKPIKHRLSS